MLETGRTCLQCGVRQLKRFFQTELSVCIYCENENQTERIKTQGILRLRYERKDSEVKECKCGSLFVFRNRGDLCYQCRPTRRENVMQKEGATNTEVILNTESESIKGKESVIMLGKTENDMNETTQQKKQESEKQNTSLKTETGLTDTKETTTQKTEESNLPASLPQEGGATPLLDCSASSIALKEEISQSVKLLGSSGERLIQYAEKLTRPMMCSEQREVIMEMTTGNVMNAVRCLEEARNTMKTKLEYLKFAKSFDNKK